LIARRTNFVELYRQSIISAKALKASRCVRDREPTMKILQAMAFAVLLTGSLGAAQPPAGTIDFGPQTLVLINSYRASNGLRPLAANGTLKALARQHSRDQAARGAISHDGFRQRSAQARAAGMKGICAENVGVGYQNAQHLFSGWRNSSAHNTNMLRPNLRYAGVSIVGNFSTFFACQ
jgi:uncharacterized protein YkwD